MGDDARAFAQGWVAAESEDHDKINVKRIYIDMNGGNFYDGVMFSQIMYWNGKTSTGQTRLQVKREGEYWLAKQYEDWWDECRINERTARQCLKRMIDSGLLIKKLWHFGGKPTVHIRVNWQVFMYRVKMIRHEMSNKDWSIRHNMSNTTGLSDIKCQMQSASDVNCYTETTAETTLRTENNDSAPNGAGKQSTPEVKKSAEKKPRQPDPIFDAVKEHVFGITDGNAEGGRIGKISNWLKQKYDGPAGRKVGKISNPAKPEHIGMFVIWYKTKYPDTSLPRDFEKFVEHWREWGSSQRQSPPKVPAKGSPGPHIVDGVNMGAQSPEEIALLDKIAEVQRQLREKKVG